MSHAEAEARMRRWIELARAKAKGSSWWRAAMERLGLVARARGAVRDGVPVGEWRFSDGRECTVYGTFSAGEAHGVWIEYDRRRGPVIEAGFTRGRCDELTWRRGEVDGELDVIEHYEDGELTYRSTETETGGWERGRRAGEHLLFRRQGELDDERSGTYVDGVRTVPACWGNRLVFVRDPRAREAITDELVGAIRRAQAHASSTSRDDPTPDEWFALGAAGDASPNVRARVTPIAAGVLARVDTVAFENNRFRIPSHTGYGPEPTEVRIARLREIFAGSRERKLGAVPFLAVASFDRSGYVREVAVELLAKLEGGEEIGFLLARLDDWVEPVRVRAERALETRVVVENAGTFARELPTLDVLARRLRAGRSPILERVARLWSTEAGTRALRARFASSDRATARAAVRIALEHGVRKAESADLALASDDALVRLRAAGARIALATPDERRDVLARLFRDRATAVRIEALRADDAGAIPLETALLDPNRSVRELARFLAAERRPELDVAAFLERSLAAENERVRLRVYASSATNADASRVRTLLTRAEHDGVRAVEAVLLACEPGTAGDELELLERLLASDRPRSSRAAVRHLAATGLDDDAFERVLEVARSTPHAHVQRNLARLARELPRWKALVLFLELLARSSGEHARGEIGLAAWISDRNKRFAAPRPAELTRVRELSARAIVPDAMRVELDELLASTRPS